MKPAPILSPLDSATAIVLISPRAQNHYAAAPFLLAGMGTTARRTEMLHESFARASARASAPVGEDLRALAAFVRAQAEAYVQREGEDASLEDWCGIVSSAFVALARDAGFSADVARGTFTEIPHYWAIVGGPSFDHTTFVDLTATQFELDIPPVFILEPGDEERSLYEVLEVGKPPLPACDQAHLVLMTMICRLARGVR